MIDFARITIRAGDGGQGSGSFRHIKGKRYGKADGGDGGRGGNVYCQATRDLNTLEPYRYVKDYKAENGQPGASNLRRGVNGQDEVLKVPVGTQINILLGPATNFPPAFGEARLRRPVSAPSRGGSNLDGKSFGSLRAAGNPSIGVTQQNVIYDLVEEGQRVLVASGGEGGRGNAKLRDGFGRRPRTGEKGQIGETCNITLELKLIADVGLVGLPNSGKSTLLSVLTSARPKIADYPFTTLEPNLGVMDFAGPVSSFLPAFGEARLRRPASALQPFLSKSDNPNVDTDSEKGSVRAVGNPSRTATPRNGLYVLWQDYQTVRNELKVYSKDLAKKKEIIVLSKTDLVDKSAVNVAIAVFAKHRKKAISISAKTGIGLDTLIQMILKINKKR